MNLKNRATAGLPTGVTSTLGLPATTTTVAAAAPTALALNAHEAAIATAPVQPVPGLTSLVPDQPRANTLGS